MKKLLLSLAVLMCGAATASAVDITATIQPTPAAGIVDSFGPTIPFHYLYNGLEVPDGDLYYLNGTATVTVTKDGVEVPDLNPELELVDYGFEVRINLARQVTEPGKYSISVSKGLFFYGGGMMSYNIGAASFDYEIQGAVEGENYEVTADPASGANLPELGTIDVRFREEGSDGYLNLVGGSADQLVATLSPQRAVVDAEFPDNDHSLLRLTVALNDEPLTAQGNYTLSVKQPQVEEGEDPVFYFTFADGRKVYMRDFQLSYTIGQGTGVQTLEARQGQALYYDLTGRRVAQPQDGVYIRVQGGKASKVVK